MSPTTDVKNDSQKMLKYTLEVFKAIKEGYIRKQKTAAIVIDKVYETLDLEKQEQLQQLDNILATKDEMAQNLATISSKYQKAEEKQALLSSRIDTLSSMVVPRMQLTQAERLMKMQLLEVESNCEKYKDSLRQLQARHEYAANKFNSSLIIRQQVNLDDSYVETISTQLERQSESISDLVQRINRIKITLHQTSPESSRILSNLEASLPQKDTTRKTVPKTLAPGATSDTAQKAS